MKRHTLAVLALAMLAACHASKPKPAPTPVKAAAPAAAPSQPATPTPPAAQPPNLAQVLGGFGNGEPQPRPYFAVVPPTARTRSGLLKTHELRGRLLFELPPSQLGAPMLIVTSIRGTPSGIGLTGTIGGPNRLVRWERRDNRVLLRAASFRNVSTDTTGPVNRAVDIIRYEPILATFSVEAFGPDSAPVIDVTRMFTGGVSELAGAGQRVNVDPSRSFIEKVAAYPRNVEIEASQSFLTPPPQIPGPPPAIPPRTSTTELYHFSIVRLPDVPMRPRFADDRVGYLTTQQLDFGSAEQRVTRRTLIARWRLECADPSATPCVPKQPITYYVDPATPTWLVPWVRRGIEEWNGAFEAAGFRNAVVSREAPPNDPSFAGENANVSMVRWLPSITENAVGPSTVDPRSGEILDADVQLYQNVMNLNRAWYFAQVGPLDPRARTLPLPDSLMGRLMQAVVAHEIGHTLGLPHNMKASSLYPVDSLRSKTWLATMGFTPSIMDYARFDYVAQPEDRIDVNQLVPRVGPYDRYALRWGYARIAGAATPEQERATLDRWAREQDSVPWLRFGGDAGLFGADPGEANEAVGDADAVRATALGMKNLRRAAKMLEPAVESSVGASYDDLEELYGRLVDQWATELGHVARIPGGALRHEKAVGQPGPIYTPVSASRQRAAIAFLNAEAFATPRFLLDSAILRKIEPSGSLDRIGSAQRRVLAILLDNARLERMVEQDAQSRDAPSRDAYPLGAMLAALRRGLFAEAYAGAPADAYRRRVQRSFVELLAQKLAPSPLVTAPDAMPLVRGELADLDRDLATAVRRATDRTTRVHFEALREGIRVALRPSR